MESTPIKKIAASDKDRVTLERLVDVRRATEKAQPENYKDRVVMKPWGHEFLIFENAHVAIWFLHIGKGHSTSMHCHPRKKTSLVLLSGRALCNTFHHRNYLDHVDGLVIDPGVFHSTKALSSDGIDVIEIETPPHKTDLVRLDDAYGRERDGYEGFSEMRTDNLARFDYFFFTESAPQDSAHASAHYRITMQTFMNVEHFRGAFREKDDALYGVCRGQIYSERGHAVLDVGEIQRGGSLRQEPDLRIAEKTVVMMVEKLHADQPR